MILCLLYHESGVRIKYVFGIIYEGLFSISGRTRRYPHRKGLLQVFNLQQPPGYIYEQHVYSLTGFFIKKHNLFRKCEFYENRLTKLDLCVIIILIWNHPNGKDKNTNACNDEFQSSKLCGVFCRKCKQKASIPNYEERKWGRCILKICSRT